MTPDPTLFPPPKVRRFTLPHRLDRLVGAGITSTDPEVIRRQRMTNVAIYAAMADQISHIVSNAMHDLSGLMVIHAYNAVMVLLELFIHRLHRRGPHASALTFVTLLIAGNMFVVAMLGRDSGLHVYFTLAGAALLVLGAENWKQWGPMIGLAFLALLASVTLVPPRGPVVPDDSAIRQVLAQQAMIAAFLLNGALILYALTALRRAQSSLQVALGRSDSLLLNLLPAAIAERLKAAPTAPIADRLDDVTILFADLVGFSAAAHDLPPEHVVAYLDDLVRAFDRLCVEHGVEKIKTIGDSYMAASGVGAKGADGALRMGRFALAIAGAQRARQMLGSHRLDLRIGLHCGEATAGVIGDIRTAYDLWGDAVNTASRMESTGLPGRIHVSDAFRQAAGEAFRFVPRGLTEMKGLGAIETFFLEADRGDQTEAASIAEARSMQ